jgi:hypothetical protein
MPIDSLRYFTLVIPWVPLAHATEWHPTDAAGPFATLLSALPAWRPYAKGAEPHPELAPLWGLSSGFAEPPAIGSRVDILINGFGPGVVLSYFVEAGFLGVAVRPDVRPAWHVRQSPERNVALVFGAEVRPEPEGAGAVWTRAAADAAAWRKRRGRSAAVTDRVVRAQWSAAMDGPARLSPTPPYRGLAHELYSRAFRVHAHVDR